MPELVIGHNGMKFYRPTTEKRILLKNGDTLTIKSTWYVREWVNGVWFGV